MSDFDLIPASYRSADRARTSLRVAALAAGAVLFSGLLTTIGLRMHNNHVQEQLAALRMQSNALAVIESRYQLMSTARAALRERSVVLAALQRQGSATALIAAVEQASAPLPLWLQRWDYVSDGLNGSDTHRMQLRGDSKNHEALTRFVDSLLVSPAVADVRISAANERSRKGAIDFQLELQL